MTIRDASPTSTSSTLSNITVQTEKHVEVRAMSSASPSISTPPTSLDDEYSVLSDAAKAEPLAEAFESVHPPRAADDAPEPSNSTPEMPPSEGRRSARSSRKSVTTYNVQILAGTAIHTPTKYLEKHHKNVLHGSVEGTPSTVDVTSVKKRAPKTKSAPADVDDPVEEQLVTEAAQAARRRTSSRVTDLRKEALRNITGVGQAVANALSDGRTLVQNSLRNAALDNSRKATQTKRPHAATEDGEQTEAGESRDDKVSLKPKAKVWLRQGLYIGQHRDFDPRLSESQNRAKKRVKRLQDANVLPLPMFAAERMLNEDLHHVFRDFKLPFDTYNPLPRKVKVDGWVKLNKNRFIGDASALWKRDKQDASQCYCDPEDGCGDACHNRIMAYECDDTNCRLGPQLCANRPFAELKRRAKGNRYDYGVEVLDTVDRGYGVRAMRMFDPHQIIVEYAGEIITQSECERRMKQVYKKDKCYYLMSFDNKMIIDATRGTIARFVNHSCEPNCEMIKWTVGGEPRMALFAGRRGIMTGEELTYDYNFDPFSQKNIQQCRCGTESCRGVLGPKPKKPVEDKSLASALIAGTKRKLHDFMDSVITKTEHRQTSPKKRRIHSGNSAAAKTNNANVQTLAARDRAEREATEHDRQIASRQSRALNRSTPPITGRNARSKLLQGRMPSVKSSRITTVSYQRKVSRSSALKNVKRPARPHTTIRHALSASSKKRRQVENIPSTPTRSVRGSSVGSDETESPNITPASLRSASKKLRLTSTPAKDGSTMMGNEYDDSRSRTRRRGAKSGSSIENHANAAAVNWDYDTDNEVEISNHPTQSRPRTTSGRFPPRKIR